MVDTLTIDTKEANQKLVELIKNLKDVSKTLKECGDKVGANSLKKSIQSLTASTSEARDKIEKTKERITEKLGDTFVHQFDKALKNMNADRAKAQIESLYRELKGSGEYGKANALKQFMTELKKAELDKGFEQRVKEIQTLLEKEVDPKMLKKFNNAVQHSGNLLTNFWYRLSNVGKMLATGITVKGIRNVWYELKRWLSVLRTIISESSGYIENLHLFEVAMGAMRDEQGELDKAQSKYYMRGIKYQNKMHEMYATNISQTIKYQGLFNQMAKSMGIPEEAAYNLSESLTTVGMDLSSLFNIDQTAAMQKLRAGIAGQTKPLRDLGLDITAQSLKPILEEAGINRSVKNLSQAEKMLVRYIAILKQAKAAHGDYAETINLPANQLKIFSNQIKELAREIGNVFLPILKNVLPVVNGFIMALKEVVHFIAVLCGYTEDLTQGMSTLADDTDDTAVDLGFEDELEDAKKLKKFTVGFDELNILKPKDDDSNGGLGGVDPALLALMDKYNESLTTASNKAIEIRDTILEWLGFTKTVDEETGKVSWTLGEGYTKLELIRDILIVIAGIKVASVIFGFINALRSTILWQLLSRLLSYVKNFITGLWAIIKGTLAGNQVMKSYLSILLKALAKVVGYILIVLGSIELFKVYSKIVDQGTMSLKDMWGMLKAIAMVVLGIGLAFGAIPALIAALVGAIFNLFVTIKTYWNEIPTMVERDLNNVGASTIKLFINVGARLVAAFKTVVHEIDTMWNGFFQMIYDAFGGVILWIAEKFDTLIEKVTGAINKIINFFGGEEIGTFSLKASVQAMMDENKATLEEKDEEYYADMEEVNKNLEKLLDGIEKQRKENETNIYKDYLSHTSDERLQQLNETKKQNDELIGKIKDFFNSDAIEAPSLSQRAMQTSEDMNLATHEQTDVLKNISEQLGGMNIENILNDKDLDGDFDKGDSQTLDEVLSNTSDLTSFMEDSNLFSEEMLDTDKDMLGSMKYTQGLESDSSERLEDINTYLNTNLSNILQQIKRACENIRINIIKNYYYGDTQGYATGGMPDSASLFYAHENGIPELVGRVGNKTGVMNNEQIVDAVSVGVASAVAQVMARDKERPINVSVQIDDREIARANNSGQKKLGYSIVGGAFANG